MQEVFDLSKFDEYREDNRREVKKAGEGLPISLWDTYSAFANCYGGVIILGVKASQGFLGYDQQSKESKRQFAV